MTYIIFGYELVSQIADEFRRLDKASKQVEERQSHDLRNELRLANWPFPNTSAI